MYNNHNNHLFLSHMWQAVCYVLFITDSILIFQCSKIDTVNVRHQNVLLRYPSEMKDLLPSGQECCPQTAMNCQPPSGVAQCHTSSQGGHIQRLINIEPLIDLSGLLEGLALSPQLGIIPVDHPICRTTCISCCIPLRLHDCLTSSAAQFFPNLKNDDPKSIS